MTMTRRALIGLFAAAGISPRFAFAATESGYAAGKIFLAENRAFMAVKIGEAAPLLFFIDTGTYVNLIDEKIAKRLKLEQQGRVQSRVVGGMVESRIYRGRDIDLAGVVVLKTALFSGTPMRPAGVDGALAADLLTEFDSELDFEAQQWRVWTGGRPSWDGLTEVARSDIDRSRGGGAAKIYGHVAVNGQAFDLLLDTGAPNNLSLDSSAVRRSGLWDDAKPYVPHRQRGLAGAGKPGRLVRAETVNFGGIEFRRPIIFLNDPDENQNGHRHEGILGLNLLRHMTLATDVRRSRLWVKRNTLPPVRQPYPMSGLWLERNGERIVVQDVGTGSPAALAGVEKGDCVVGENWSAVLARITGKAGSEVRLKLERGGAASERVFTLKPYL